MDRNRMWVATERRGWCLEVPLLPLHPNLHSPSSRPFLKLGGLELTQGTPPQPQGRGVGKRAAGMGQGPISPPVVEEERPAQAASELLSPAAQQGVWLTSPLPQNWPRGLAGLLPLWGRKPKKGPQLPHSLLTLHGLWTQPSHFTSLGRVRGRRWCASGEDGGITQSKTEAKA